MVTGATEARKQFKHVCRLEGTDARSERGQGQELGEPSQQAWQDGAALHRGHGERQKVVTIHISLDGHKISTRNPAESVLTLKMRKHAETWKDKAHSFNSVVM